ncbi:tyrosine-protein phosphatase non-receptor type 23 [Nothoprocta perdicaria]|uniref:tyrosine-protein phosphatase non-receptor type 23 n=1 Tax=Nothoprocta perdicaria TaxID=30464 RepID=UPI000E1B55E3|nr:tyrosine-protein phosphatase non-receptor type 23 [Nothoprocta perdicaria]
MEAVPRMPMIWLDLKEAGEFAFNGAVKKFVLKNYGENPENYNEELRKLEGLRQSAVTVPRDFEGCSTLRKYFGQLHYLQSRIPMGAEQEAAVPVAWTEIFSGKTVTHEDIKYEQACILYNLGALHSMLGAMDKRVSEEGMKVSCTHFQCAAGAFTYLRDHFPHSYSVDMSHQILNLNINLMLGQAQECLLEKSMLDNRKSFLVARISAQVVDYYKEACRALENSETASLLGKIQKDWKKLVQMKIYYFAAVAHLHMGKQAEEQQKFGERVIYFQSALDKLNEAIKLAKGQPETVQEALRFTMDVIGGKYNSAKKDNDFIYHEAVPALDTLQAVKGAPLVKALPVNPTDPAVTGPDIFAKLVPMAAHEASSLYSEEKAKLLRDVMAKIEAKNEVLDQFMDSMQLDPDTVDNLDMYNHIPPVLMEKCAALSVRPDTVKNLVQSMQVLSGVFTDVEASLKEIRDLLEEDEEQERKLQELLGRSPPGPRASPPCPALAEVSKECSKYLEVHEKASFTNTELHKAMNLHIGNLRLLSGPLEQVRAALPAPALTEDDKQVLQNLKRVLAKVQEMREQRAALEQQLREMIQKDDITTALVTADRSEMKKLFEEQLKKYDQIKVYLEQNLAAQENVLKALTDANVKYAAVRKALAEVEHKWNTTVQTLVASYEAYEDLMKKSQEGKDFYTDLEGKAAKLLEKARAACRAADAARQQLLEKELRKQPPPRPTAPKPALAKTPEGQHGGSKAPGGPPLLQPTKADAKEGQRPRALQLIESDPYEQPERLRRLRADLERFRGLVERLECPAAPGAASPLDAVWKELQDAQERDARQLSIAIARCYSMKNRHQDVMPYDRNRVLLRSGKDDYINASRVEDLSPYCPAIIATQAPLLGTAADFWLMIYEQKVSVVVMLVSEQELDKQKVLRYFPSERGQPVVQGPLTLVLSSVRAAPTHVERMITLQYREQSLKRTVVHLQFTSWPELGLPESKGSLLSFIHDVHGHYLHQRPLHTPVVVHCSSGVGRTGAFCLLYAAVQELEAGNGIPALAPLVRRLRQQRKHMLQEKLHLKFCFEALLLHAEQLLQRHGAGPPAACKAPASASPKLYVQQDPQDLVLGGDVPISSIQATIAKLSVRAPGAELPSSNHVAELPPAAAAPAAAPVPAAASAASSSSSSSLELLASLTPEAFTLDAALKGKQRMNKQNFLQAQAGEGLRGPPAADDPLSLLDPLWSLNKT